MKCKLTIKELTQKEADEWLKRLYSSGNELQRNLMEAFHVEKESLPPCALIPEIRRYYMVYANDDAELLSGINSKNCDISSFAKVVTKTESKARGRDCVKKLIEDIVVNECRKAGRAYFSVATNKEGKAVFEYLRIKKNLPKGIKEIMPSNGLIIYYSFVLYIY